MNNKIDIEIIKQAVVNTLSMLGINANLKENVTSSFNCKVTNSVLAMVGVLGEIKLNVIYSMDKKTSESIVATMMGIPDYKMDSIGRSAIAELGNMVSGSICTELSAHGTSLDITTPTVLTGIDISCIIYSVESIHIEFETDLGIIGIDFAFES